MSQPILAFQSSSSTSTPKTTPNLLPCRIHHDGSVEPCTDSFFWNPTRHEEDGLKVSYFRGRKLHGKTVPLPDGYKGFVASKVPKPKQEHEQQTQKPRLAHHEMSFVMENQPEVVDLEAEDSGSGQEPEVGGMMMEIQAEFEEVIVWGHESLPDAAGGDGYVRGVEEWIGFASKVHSF